METRSHSLSAIQFTLLVGILITGCGRDPERPKDPTSEADVLATWSASAKPGPSSAAKAALTFTSLSAGEETPSGTERIFSGQLVSGTLSLGDSVLDDGSHYDVWVYETTEAQNVEITMSSTQFDAFLHVYQQTQNGLELLAANDDVGSGTDSGILARVTPGLYLILANSCLGAETGEYSLRLEVLEMGEASHLGRIIEAGQTYTGQLGPDDETPADDRYFERWVYQGRAEEQITVTMTSADFDTYLFVGTGQIGHGFHSLGVDDDGAGGTNSRLTIQLPESGTVGIYANSYLGNETGTYTIRMESVQVDWQERFPGGGDPSGQYALLVGINDYAGNVRDLTGPVEDALAMGNILVNKYGFPPENVVTLRDAEATRAAIGNAFSRHLGQAGPDGVAVFFFSGHGTRLDENTGVTAPLDSEPDGVDEALAVWGGPQSSTILDDELGWLADQLPAQRTLLVVDACHSGTLSRAPDETKEVLFEDVKEEFFLPRNFISREIDASAFAFGAEPGSLRDIFVEPQRHILMAAVREDQTALDNPAELEGPLSLFTYFLSRSLDAAGPDATFQSLHRQVIQGVENWALALNDPRYEELEHDAQLLGPGTDTRISVFLGRR
jgi:hypothetical protein